MYFHFHGANPKRCVPFVSKAILLVKYSHKLVRDKIISCDIALNECELKLRSVISDNRSTNVSTYKDLLKHYPVEGNNYAQWHETAIWWYWLFL